MPKKTVTPASDEAQETKNTAQAAEKVEFTPEQLQVMNSLIEQAVKSSSGTTGARSVYGQRDPQSIDTVNVRRFDGKFVIGFKDQQNDSMRKAKGETQYIVYKPDPVRKLNREPYITLILSDGTDTEEKEVMLVDYYSERQNSFQAKVVDTKVEKIIQNHGVLGGSSSYAREVDANGKPVVRGTLKAESMIEKRTFLVELPGFDKPVEFLDDFKGPLS